MNRVYTLNATIYGGERIGRNDDLQGFSASNTTRVGWYKKGNNDYAGAVSLFFDSDALQDLRSKTILSMKLAAQSSDTFAYAVPIYFNVKANASTTDWSQPNRNHKQDCPRYGKIPEIDVTSLGIPTYDAFVLGGYYRTYSYVTVTSAALKVTTNETDKNITYDANGGTNDPSQTVLWGVSSWSGNVTTDTPTRTGYAFSGWNTQANGGGTAYASGASISLTDDITLYAQWTALKSVITDAPDTEIGSIIEVQWDNYGSFVNKIKFVLGSADSGEITVTGTSYSYTLPNSWLAQLPNSTSGLATVYLYTYSEGNLLGTSTETFSAIIPDSVVPSIGSILAEKVNENQTVEAWDLFLQNYSKAKITVSGCAAGSGASIAAYSFTGPSMAQVLQSSNASVNAVSDVITGSGTLTFTVTITDSRGRTASATVSISVTGYSLPTIDNVEAYRANSDGTVNQTTGTSIVARASFSFSAVGTNTLTRSISYKKHTDSTYTLAESNFTSNTWYVIAVNLAVIDSSYDVKIYAEDVLGNSATYVVIVPPVVGIAFGLKNDRARFGGPVEEAGLACDWDFKLKGDFIMMDSNNQRISMSYADLQALLALIS